MAIISGEKYYRYEEKTTGVLKSMKLHENFCENCVSVNDISELLEKGRKISQKTLRQTFTHLMTEFSKPHPPVIMCPSEFLS